MERSVLFSSFCFARTCFRLVWHLHISPWTKTKSQLSPTILPKTSLETPIVKYSNQIEILKIPFRYDSFLPKREPPPLLQLKGTHWECSADQLWNTNGFLHLTQFLHLLFQCSFFPSTAKATQGDDCIALLTWSIYFYLLHATAA